MGVRKLNKFLTDKNIIKTYENLYEFIDNIKLESRNNSHNNKIVVAIDFWLYTHKFLHSNRSDNILLGFWNQIMKLLSCGIIPLYVIDGSVPIEKLETVIERTKKLNNYKKRLDTIDESIQKYININDLVTNATDMINNSNDDNIDNVDNVHSIITDNKMLETTDNINDLDILYEKREKLHKHVKRIKLHELHSIHKLFDVLEIPYIQAEFEADALCAKLYKNNIITCCLSDDMDMLTLGCGSTLKFHDGHLIEFNLEQIKSTLDITHEQFIDICIMFGCDYLHHSIKIPCDDVYTLVKKHGSLLDALFANDHEIFNMSNRHVQVIGDNYYQVKDIYLKSSDRENIPDRLTDIKMKKINFENLTVFLKNMKWFNTSKKNLRSIENIIRDVNQKIDNDEL